MISGETPKILIIEDEEKMARFVELELQHEGYATDKTSDGRDGLERAESGEYDLILLDVMLPSLNGIEVLRRLRKTSAVPVILLTARDAVMDKVSGLDMGANDYMTKPFAIEELLARIRAVLRNAAASQEESRRATEETTGNILRAAGIELNLSSHEALFNGEPIELTNREFILLKTLIENRNVAMSRERLLDIAWGYDYAGETNVVDVYVRYIRQKTSDSVIKTIRGVGYIINEQ